MTFSLKLRNAAKGCTNAEYKAAIQSIADSIDLRVKDLGADPTENNMIRLNGAWAVAARLLRNLPDEGSPSPSTGIYTFAAADERAHCFIAGQVCDGGVRRRVVLQELMGASYKVSKPN